jgi:hypothetical protein
MHWGSGAAEKAMSTEILIVRSEMSSGMLNPSLLPGDEHQYVRYVSSVPHIDAHRFCLGDVLELRALVL